MFETSKIPFCGKQACNVVDDSFKAELLEILQKNYYMKIVEILLKTEEHLISLFL